MPWYLPITILPGIALLILSSVHLITSLNDEISKLHKENYKLIIAKKIEQLKKLIIALISLYISAFLMVLSGLLASIDVIDVKISKTLLVIGVLALFIGLLVLLIYTLKSYKIRIESLNKS